MQVVVEENVAQKVPKCSLMTIKLPYDGSSFLKANLVYKLFSYMLSDGL